MIKFREIRLSAKITIIMSILMVIMNTILMIAEGNLWIGVSGVLFLVIGIDYYLDECIMWELREYGRICGNQQELIRKQNEIIKKLSE